MPSLTASVVRSCVCRWLACVAASCAVVAPSLAGAAAPSSADDLRKQLVTAKAQGSVTSAVEACTALFRLDTEDGVDAVADVGLTKDWPEIENFILNYVQLELKPGPALTRVCHLARKHKEVPVRVIFTLALAVRNEPEAYKAVLESLFDPIEAVSKSALEALRRRDEIAPVDHLIQALAHHEARGPAGANLCYETRTLLTELTGKDLELAQDWKTYWDTHKDGFQRPPKANRGTPAEEQARTKVKGKGPAFFQHEVVAPRIVFVLDVSDSMAIRDPLPEEPDPEAEKAKKGGRTGVKGKDEEKKEKPKQEDIPESRQRLARVKKELIQVLSELPETVHFNIVTFNHKIGRFKPGGLLPADARTKQEAIQFVQGFSPDGLTHTDEALEAAFDIQEVSTIYLLSDGAPRKGDTLLPFEPIWDWIQVNNRFRRIKINTIGFEQEGANLKKFLRRVAFLTRGDYTELK